MDKKFDTYKGYNWANDDGWQRYLQNIYPTPPPAKIEKIRRKWYKKNKDPDFDIDFDPQSSQNQQERNQQQQRAGGAGANMGAQQQFYQQFQNQYQRQNPTGAYTAQQHASDKMESLKWPYLLCWFLYIFLYPLGFMSNQLCMAAQAIGILKKAGMPKMQMEYVQSVVLLDEFSNLTYLLSVLQTSQGLFINSPILLSGILILCFEFKKVLDKNPTFPFLQITSIKENIYKGANLQIQDQGRNLKADLEVYVGFYLVAAIFIGKSSLIAIMFYWQMMRMRYMMNPHIQAAFQRLDMNLMVYLGHPYCPGVVRSAYQQVKGMIGGLVDAEAQQQRVQQSGGGVMGALKNSCNIF